MSLAAIVMALLAVTALLAWGVAAWVHQLPCPAQNAARDAVIIHQSFLTATITRTRLPQHSQSYRTSRSGSSPPS